MVTPPENSEKDADPIIEVRALTTRFGDHVVHDRLDLDVKRGEILGIVGGSGTGKSVLLRSIIGLNEPASGTIRVFGQNLRELDPEARREQERRWGVLFQEGALFSNLSVLQNVQVALREHLRMPQTLMDEIASLKIQMVGLEPSAANKRPSELSGGMKKRAGLARALVLDPEIVFLDEPTAGLDPIGAAAFDELVLTLKHALGLTVFMVTHDLDSLYAICDRIAVLAEKRVLVSGTIEDMLKCDHPWVKEYFQGPRARAASLSNATAAKARGKPGAPPERPAVEG